MKLLDNSLTKQFTVLLSGTARTATTSLYEFLSLSNEVSVSQPKETINSVILQFKRNYIDYYTIQQNTSILFDGTSDLLKSHTYLVEKIQKEHYVKNVKLLYTIRNPIIRTFSALNIKVRAYISGNWERRAVCPWLTPDHLINDYLLFEEIKSRINDLNFLKIADNLLSKENILVLSFYNLKNQVDTICDFLNIKKMNPDLFLKTNSTNDLPQTLEQLQIKKRLIDWFIQNKETILELSKQCKKDVKKEYEISDFRKENEPDFYFKILPFLEDDYNI